MNSIFTLSFFVVIFVTTAAQKITTTNGDSGPTCGGKDHRCISNATCSDSNRRCVCPKGLEGNAKLGCVNPDDVVLYVQSDPHVKNFYQEFISVKTPCRYRLVKYSLPTVPQPCRVEVYADNYLYTGGQYYANRIELRLQVYTSRWRKLDVRIEGMAENGVYNFSEWRKKNSGDWSPPNQDSERLGKVKVLSSYDQVDNIANITVEQCGLSMRFRPADWTKEFQHQVPGMVVVLGGPHLNDIEIEEAELSSTPTGPSITQLAVERQMDIEELILEMTMVNSDNAISPEPWCDSATDDFQRYCYDENDLQKSKEALDVCGGIFTNNAFLKCLAVNDMDQSFQTEIFSNCMWGVCGKNGTECELSKTKIRESTNCSLPNSLKNYDCRRSDSEIIPM